MTVTSPKSQVQSNRRLKPSDPIKLNCNCSQNSDSLVVLFYSYVKLTNPSELVAENKELLSKLDLTGKVRIGHEGINITVAGNKLNVEEYLTYWCKLFNTSVIDAPSIPHLSNSISSGSKQDLLTLQQSLFTVTSPFEWTEFKTKFFKPTPGCKHVFDSGSVKLIDEICPLGVESKNWNPVLDWSNSDDDLLNREKLNPSEFHQYLTTNMEDDVVLLDVRNYYESKVGKFENAWCPPIRSFKGLPSYLTTHKDKLKGKTLLTYCTGGIRCEKATAYIRDFIQTDLTNSDDGEGIKTVKMLEGGIHNYLEWCKKEGIEDTKWLGRNYVFDARQSTDLESYSIHTTNSNNTEKEELNTDNLAKQSVNNLTFGTCTLCHAEQYHFIKCQAPQCHLILIRCPTTCSTTNPYCCTDCEQFELMCKVDDKLLTKPRTACSCELLRREQLKE